MTNRPMFNPKAHASSAALNAPLPGTVVAAEPVKFDPAGFKAKLAEREAVEVKRIADVRARPIGPLKTTSFSALVGFESCAYSAYLKRVEKCPDPSGPAADRGSRLHTSAEDVIQGVADELDKEFKHYKELVFTLRDRFDQGNILIEQDWAFRRDWTECGWNDADVWQRTKLDVFEFQSPTSGYIIDWKSGRKFGNEMKHGQQLQLYAVAAFVKYPALEFIQGEMVYIDQNEKLTQTYSRNQAMQFFDRWDIRFNEMTTAVKFPAKPNQHNCRYCAMAKIQDGQTEPACGYRYEPK